MFTKNKNKFPIGTSSKIQAGIYPISPLKMNLKSNRCLKCQHALTTQNSLGYSKIELVVKKQQYALI